MKDNVINVYNSYGDYYVAGDVLARIIHFDMGIDSRMGYYKISKEDIEKYAQEKGYKVVYSPITRDKIVMIREKYFDDEGDRLYRIQHASYDDLVEYRNDLLAASKKENEEFGDKHFFELVDAEIHARNSIIARKKALKSKLTEPLKNITDTLIKSDDFDVDIILQQVSHIEDLLYSFKEKNEKSKK